MSCVWEALLRSWPIFTEFKGFNKILQWSKEIASWLGTQLWCNALRRGPDTLCYPSRRKNAAVINLLIHHSENQQQTGDLRGLNVTVVQADISHGGFPDVRTDMAASISTGLAVSVGTLQHPSWRDH